MALLLPSLAAAILFAWALAVRGQAGLPGAFLGAGLTLAVWTGVLYVAGRRTARELTLTVALRKHHWVQALAQLTVFLYWGWHVSWVYDFFPLIAAQIVFAYGVESLLSWSRRGTYALGFGPVPVIFSINLFLWFEPAWFHWQFVMIVVGYLGKDFIRWTRHRRSKHIFNPSSFPLGLASVALLVAGASGITSGEAIASSQYYPPNMYLLIFLAALPGQVLFGVARMTMPAVITAYLLSVIHLEATGTYLFFDSHIPVPVFLGMHLLFTDPSTSPRNVRGQILFGVLYGLGTTACYVLLSSLGSPTFYDKLLPVPIMNLLVRRIEALTRREAGEEAVWTPGPTPVSKLRANVGYTAAWGLAFLALTGVRGVGDDHPGQALPFWWETCREGNSRACEYATVMTRIYCRDGSGWACNEVGVLRHEIGEDVGAAFRRACELGFPAGCENEERIAADGGEPSRAPPRLADLPIVLRGTKPPLHDLSPEHLYARACEHGWARVCDASRESISGGHDRAEQEGLP